MLLALSYICTRDKNQESNKYIVLHAVFPSSGIAPPLADRPRVLPFSTVLPPDANPELEGLVSAAIGLGWNP